MINAQEALGRLAGAVDELFKDTQFCATNPGELAVTSRLAQLMAPRFSEWSVCAEWDRKGIEQKMLHYGYENEVAKLRAIRPDIIVHRIGSDENILVVEAKKAGGAPPARDRAKLSAMTSSDSGYSYQVGARLILDVAHTSVTDSEVFRDGKSDAEMSAFLSDLVRKI